MVPPLYAELWCASAEVQAARHRLMRAQVPQKDTHPMVTRYCCQVPRLVIAMLCLNSWLACRDRHRSIASVILPPMVFYHQQARWNILRDCRVLPARIGNKLHFEPLLEAIKSMISIISKNPTHLPHHPNDVDRGSSRHNLDQKQQNDSI